MPIQPSTAAIPDRRQRFRAFMKRFNPTAPARVAIGEGLIYHDAVLSVFRKLAARADLGPGSQQLVVGGIGSGKTTQLLMAEQELVTHEQILPVYVDVSVETDLSNVSSGALLASLGLLIWKAITAEFRPSDALSKAHEAIWIAAYGEDTTPLSDRLLDHAAGYSIRMTGKLRPPFPAIRRDVRHLAESVSVLNTFLRDRGRELVAIFDGLDRLINADRFWSVAEQDLRAIKPLEISVLAAGPLSIMYGPGRQVKDYFDEVYYLGPAIADPKVSNFLLDTLFLRGADELMRPNQMRRLCLASGGVLRDLISLARNAGENAYLDDADYIEDIHVEQAIEQLGNSYLLGLGTQQKALLTRVLEGDGFSPSDPERLELLITRRILEQSESRYEVHPALAAVLTSLPGDLELE